MRNARFVELLLASALLSPWSAAQAGGPPELLTELAVDPSDPSHMVLLYENAGSGLIVSTDGGESWRALCPDAMQPPDIGPVTRLRKIGIGGDGTLFVGLFDNALFDDGHGCNFAADPAFAGEWVTGFAHHPSDPEVFYALTSTAPNGSNGISRRVADGAWEPLGSRDATLLGGLEVVELASGQLRFYQSGSLGELMEGTDEARPDYRIRVSEDDGETWTAHHYDGIEPHGRFQLQAVDPTNPDRIVASLHRATERRDGVVDDILVSTDQGATFEVYLTVTQFGGLDMAPDGRIWIGDLGDSFDPESPVGLFYAPSLDESPTKVDDTYPVSCVQYLPAAQELFVCSRTHAGTVSGDGMGYTRSFDFADVERTVECGNQDNTRVCRIALNRFWCTSAHFNTAPLCCPYVDEMGRLANSDAPEDLDCSSWEQPDAGAPAEDAGMQASEADAASPAEDAGARSDAGSAPDDSSASSSGCGCELVGVPAARPTVWLLLGATLAVARIRKRKRRGPR